MPNQNDQQKNPVSVISPQADLPPMPPAFQSVTPPSEGSGAPVDESTKTPPASNLPPIISSNPKKKFGGGRIIATILGILLLVGGVGAGLVLTGQTQLFQQQAAGGCTCNNQLGNNVSGSCNADGSCTCPSRSTLVSNNCPKPPSCQPRCLGKECGDNNCGGSCGSCGADANCQSGKCVPNQPPPPSNNCGTGLNCSASPVTGGSACNGGGYTNYCCPSGQTISNGACVAQITCPSGRSCGASAAKGASQCVQPGGGLGYCCPAGQTYDQFNGCFAPTTTSCTSDAQCASVPFQICDRGTNKCVYSPNINCGRNTDTGAPVCCPPNVASSCSGSAKVCEKPNRLECVVNGQFCTIDTNGCTPPTTGGGTPPPGTTPPGITASCQNVKAYDSSWALLSAAQLSQLKVGAKINFCVTGAASGGSFDMAKFTINAAAQAQTTSQRPGSQDFCQAYTIPTGVTSFNITAQIHHTTLGWSN